MTKKLGAFFIFLMLYGCAGPVRHALTPDFAEKGPRTIVILPVQWEDKKTAEDSYATGLLRLMAAEKLKAMGYSPVDMKADDEESPQNADAAVNIKIMKWDRDAVTGYASLRVKASFSLASGKDKTLWSAVYDETDFDLKLDRESNELAVIKAFEPRLQRIIDAVFSTLPKAATNAEGSKTDGAGTKKYYDWLP